MPTYEYECEVCGSLIEEFHAHPDKAPQRTFCINCSEGRAHLGYKPAVRKISAGGGVIFRGSGFYCTDYREPKGGLGERTKGELEGGGTGDAANAGQDAAQT